MSNDVERRRTAQKLMSNDQLIFVFYVERFLSTLDVVRHKYCHLSRICKPFWKCLTFYVEGNNLSRIWALESLLRGSKVLTSKQKIAFATESCHGFKREQRKTFSIQLIAVIRGTVFAIHWAKTRLLFIFHATNNMPPRKESSEDGGEKRDRYILVKTTHP